MTENEKVKSWFKTELSMREEESLDAIDCEDVMDICVKALSEIQEYTAIGTVEEFKALKEKNEPKNPIYSDFDDNGNDEIIPYKAICPVCEHEFDFGSWNDGENHHCICGQAIDWSK